MEIQGEVSPKLWNDTTASLPAVGHVESCHHTMGAPVWQMLTMQLSQDKAACRGKNKCLQVFSNAEVTKDTSTHRATAQAKPRGLVTSPILP